MDGWRFAIRRRGMLSLSCAFVKARTESPSFDRGIYISIFASALILLKTLVKAQISVRKMPRVLIQPTTPLPTCPDTALLQEIDAASRALRDAKTVAEVKVIRLRLQELRARYQNAGQ